MVEERPVRINGVERLLRIAESRSIARFPFTDPARFGLEPPDTRLTLDGETFSYGAINETTREQYVATRDTYGLTPPPNTNACRAKV